MGYALFIRYDESYRRVEILFSNAMEAGDWRDKHYPGVDAWSILRVRSCGGSGAERNDDKESNAA